VRTKLSVGREGEIVVPPKAAEALDLSGGGEVDLVTARGSFGLLVPAHADGPQAFFAGSLSALTVPEVIQFIHASLKTGILLVAGGDPAAPDAPERLRRRSVYFRDGQVVFASSSYAGDRLGPVLVRAGRIAEADLERCSRLVRSGRPLGQVLVDEGVLDAGRLYEGVTLQVREIVLAAFLEREGEFAFLEGSFDESNAVKLPERTRDLLLQGLKRIEEAERAAGSGEPAAARKEPAADVGLPPAPALTPPPSTPLEVALAGASRPRAGAKASGPFETYRRILRRVYSALAAAEADAAGRLNTWLVRLPEKKRVIFAGVHFTPDGELDVARVLENVVETGAYQGAASRARALEALEELLAFSLFEAKNRLPKAEAEALLREVGRMQVGKA
jgi:hypothetical protein